MSEARDKLEQIRDFLHKIREKGLLHEFDASKSDFEKGSDDGYVFGRWSLALEILQKIEGHG